MNNHLPAEFSDLEVFALTWALDSDNQRNQRRLASDMRELRSLYDAMLPRMDAIFKHLNAVELGRMSEADRLLLFLTLAFAEIAPAVELFNQPSVPDGYAAERFRSVKVPHQSVEF